MAKVAKGLEAVSPVNPAAPWVGGKRNLAGRLVEIIDSIEHNIYAEPFVGMGGVFFRRRHRPKSEVVNDYSKDVANFFRILREHYVPFVEMMRFQLTTRAEFERLNKVPADTLTDLQRAAQFLYLQRTTFGGKVTDRTFGVSPDRPGRFDVTKIVPVLEELHERLAGVVIECLAYQDFIQRYDRAHTLFYLDPPYYGSEDYYGKALFSRDEYAGMADQLRKLKGRFVLSINDTPEVRKIFKGFKRKAVATSYSLPDSTSTKAGELIIQGP